MESDAGSSGSTSEVWAEGNSLLNTVEDMERRVSDRLSQAKYALRKLKSERAIKKAKAVCYAAD